MEQINELATALCKAQSQLEHAKKSSANPFFKSKYADLTEVWEAIRKPLTDNGLSIVQLLGADEDGNDCLISHLMHTSGQYITSTMKLQTSKNDMQALGSAITYARRYAIQALVGVCPEDDDGERAMQGKRSSQGNYSPNKASRTGGDQLKPPYQVAIEIAKDKFKDPDEFTAWRVDNGLADDIKKASDNELAKIILELKKLNGVKV